jgi:hypothetical protein
MTAQESGGFYDYGSVAAGSLLGGIFLLGFLRLGGFFLTGKFLLQLLPHTGLGLGDGGLGILVERRPGSLLTGASEGARV